MLRPRKPVNVQSGGGSAYHRFMKTVGLVGHCGPDSSFLRMTVRKALPDAQVISIDDERELTRALTTGVDLLLFNRELGWGFNDQPGVDLIASLRAGHPNVRMMLVSNYPAAQAEAERVGALPGFGKRELGSQRVIDLLRAALPEVT